MSDQFAALILMTTFPRAINYKTKSEAAKTIARFTRAIRFARVWWIRWRPKGKTVSSHRTKALRGAPQPGCDCAEEEMGCNSLLIAS